ncbi:2-isopropylmalate synthase [Microbacterium resistens]|uniref:2-isopropylmalate synthase n=1 Tax=Microbacterium resistens TaxID=156977 RepID=A0ABU1SDE3_9MICO|nr:2-isopropylmalate synthase [Microbacterium resistens]MDR6867625.1 2-isopropylmalate synthase [Microbacterium resistens]
MSYPTLSTPAGPVPGDAPSWNRQRGSQMPSHRYADVYAKVEVPLVERDWPSRRLSRAPLWVPVDLRDGNQALAEPMDPVRKRRFFELMVAMGYKEIEVGYPSASRTDEEFVRLIAESDIAPEDVTIVVFTPARADLIEQTVHSIRGIRNEVVIHMYTATAPIWRDVVLGRGREELKRLILDGAREIRDRTAHLPNVRYQFSPEVFNLTEPEFAIEVCDAVTALWEASPDRPVILNLPATVEIASPNVYADQIEHMSRSLARRDAVILSVHPHNDRGTGIACAELAVLAGAQRVEGCLFGNGERTGNVDIATLALNLHAQGVDPMIDFSDIDEIRRVVEHCNRIEVHPRHPYVGDLVHTAFSGTHQDAIRKGFAEHRARAAAEGRDEREIAWRVPYLPVDPADLGRGYDAVIRVNSQSGKGGIAHLLETEYGVELPRRQQIDFARHVQEHADAVGDEISAAGVWELFRGAYLHAERGEEQGEERGEGGCGLSLAGYRVSEAEGVGRVRIELGVGGERIVSEHEGVGPVEALVAALAAQGIPVEVLSLHQASMESGSGSRALTLIEYRSGGCTGWAAGIDASVLGASLAAVISGAIAAVGAGSA